MGQLRAGNSFMLSREDGAMNQQLHAIAEKTDAFAAEFREDAPKLARQL